MSRVTRRVLLRHLLLSVAAAAVVALLVAAGAWQLAMDDARRQAERVARQVAGQMLEPLARHDYRHPAVADRTMLLDQVDPFLRSDIVQRVKIFSLTRCHATIVFSDDPAAQGRTGRLDRARAARLDAGQVVVQPVPDDAEHRTENGLAGSRLEVFFGFRDAGGNDAQLELYVPVDPGGMTRHTVAVLLPLVLGGMLLLAVALVPLSLASARRLERDRAEQRAARDYGLSAAERTRRDLARRLHDGVLPDLAGARLLLERLRRGSPDDGPLLDRAHALVAGDVRELRGLLADLLPPDPVDDLATALRTLAADLRRADPEHAPPIEVDVAAAVPPPAAVVLHRVAGELLRNAVRHASASTIRLTVTAAGPAVTMTVTDDGSGLASSAERTGHIGLRLVRQLLAEHGGTLDLTSTPGTGTTATVTLPA